MDEHNSPPEPCLVLHKVRGEPAFDIATRIGEDEDGVIWIIPTSGHRAYPSWWMPLNRITVNPDNRADIIYLANAVGIPKDWPDHYSTHAAAAKIDIHTLLGRPKPVYFKRKI